MRWGVEKRMEFIEFRLFWEGGINRSDIIDQFGVSVPQASKDLTLYEEKAPGNLAYDKSAKRYRASPKFKPVLLEPDASSYLSHLQVAGEPRDGVAESWLAAMPEFDLLPIPRRSVAVGVLRDILAAIREKRSVEIHYQSMNVRRPAPEWRRISPHAIGSDGLRWHVRAFCHIDEKFKDFLLSRCLKTRDFDESRADSQDDVLWHERFTVQLAPNPDLSESQQEIIAQDYEMLDGLVEVHVRKALLYYFQKRLRLDIADKLDNPHEIPVVVANQVAFEAALAEAKA
ncbi:helix-turn-helix transcriptional regulator [Yunchengibacter salinarum]|uniref:helix-turn-helix transcriptional regulator n=1 Tax=Yunchengibacter salinarum TaxID=3133399 RepID=UPI0035B601A7